MNVHLIWLLLVILWNYGFPNVPPYSDVIAAILFSFVSTQIKKYFRLPKKREKNKHDQYWFENIQLIIRCLIIWFIVSYGFGIILVDHLNLFRMGGYKLGFWFAQQGSIFTFVALIFYYSFKISEIDDKYEKL